MFFPRPSKNLTPATLSCLLAALFAFAGCAENTTNSGELLSVDSDATESVEATVELSGVSYSIALDMDLLASGAATRIAEVTVTVLDSQGAAIQGLQVAGAFRGADVSSVTGTTDRSGQVVFASPVFAEADWMGFDLDAIGTATRSADGIETSPCDPEIDPGCDGIETSPDAYIVAPETMNSGGKGIETSPGEVGASGIETSPDKQGDEVGASGIETSPDKQGDEVGASGIETSPNKRMEQEDGFSADSTDDGIETSPDGIETSP